MMILREGFDGITASAPISGESADHCDDLITTIGLDTAKQGFQLHGVDERATILRGQLRPAEILKFFKKIPSCAVGLEACGGVHYQTREIKALGHEVRLIPV